MADRPVIAGAFNAPPPNAPRETTGKDVPGPTADQIRQARANERELEPLVFTPRPYDSTPPAAIEQRPGGVTMPAVDVSAAAAELASPSPIVQFAPQPIVAPMTITTDGSSPEPIVTSSILRPGPRSRLAAAAQKFVDVVRGPDDRPDPDRAAADVDRGADADVVSGQVAEGAEVAAAPAPIVAGTTIEPAQPYQPAASDSDSPSRGVPTRASDPGKTITGGFGDAGEAQYFPLDGSELREMVCAQMDRLRDRLQDDLRFSMAITYPRVTARVVIEVEAFVADASFTVPAVMPPHTRTPLQIARERADEIVFVVVDEIVEMTPDGQSITPPNQVRSELGLAIPFKRFIQAGARRMMVDTER